MTHLLVSEVFPPAHGGSGRWFWEIYRRLPSEDYAIAAGENPRQDEFDRGHHLCLTRLPLKMSAWGLRSWRGLAGYFRVFRHLRQLMVSADVRALHCGRCLPEGFAAWLLHCWTGVPYLVYVHGEDATTAATSRELSWMVRRVFGGAQFLIANSRNTKSLLLEQWQLPDERVRLLYPGVDTKRFAPGRCDEAIRRELGWGNTPVVLTVGRLQKRKGHDQLIRALAEVRQTIPEVLYAIIGDGEERSTLEALVKQYKLEQHVQMMGEVDDATLIRCYQQCDLFALPNRTEGADIEGFGMVLVEAQACGRPVLAGDSGGTAETMRIGETGRIVDCSRPEPLAAALADLLSDHNRLDRMGEAGRRWVVEQFDWDVLAKQASSIFDRVMIP
jgi:phosphatidylinositol alpha-1,6-mannosyltransferase